MKTTNDHGQRIANMTFASVYPHYVEKVENNGRTVEELHQTVSEARGHHALHWSREAGRFQIVNHRLCRAN